MCLFEDEIAWCKILLNIYLNAFIVIILKGFMFFLCWSEYIAGSLSFGYNLILIRKKKASKVHGLFIWVGLALIKHYFDLFEILCNNGPNGHSVERDSVLEGLFLNKTLFGIQRGLLWLMSTTDQLFAVEW